MANTGYNQRAMTREPYDFGRAFDNRKPIKASPLQHSVLEGWKSFDEAVELFRAALIRCALIVSGGNKADAARRLNIQRQTLTEEIKRILKKYPEILS